MVGLIITIAMFLVAFLVWIIVINANKSKQTALPLLLIIEGIGLLGSGGILGCVDFDILLNIDTKYGVAFGHIQSPDTNYVLLVLGVALIAFGMVLLRSIRTRIYVLNMLGRVKHEISDSETINSLKIKDYQLKETVLDLRWAADEVNQYIWKKAKVQIEEYVNEYSARSDGSTICFTGMAPIPFEVYAGTYMAGNSVKRFFEYKRDDDVYYELLPKPRYTLGKWQRYREAPALTESRVTNADSTAEEVVLAVSITQIVQDSDLTQFNFPIIRLGIEKPKDNAITGIMQLRGYVDETNAMIIRLKNIYPYLTRIHLVGAVPSCYAFDLGCKLSHLDNRLPEIVVYHYVSTAMPKYEYGIVVTGKNKGILVTNN